jgi:hypothetical protein
MKTGDLYIRQDGLLVSVIRVNAMGNSFEGVVKKGSTLWKVGEIGNWLTSDFKFHSGDRPQEPTLNIIL